MTSIITQDKTIVLSAEQIQYVPILRDLCNLVQSSDPIPLTNVSSQMLLTLIELSRAPHESPPTGCPLFSADQIIHAIHICDYLGMDEALHALYAGLQNVIQGASVDEIAQMLVTNASFIG